MPSSLTLQKEGDDSFLRQVAATPTFQTTLTANGLSAPYFGIATYNAVMIISRPDWTIHVPACDHSVNVHFEARARNEFRLEVGPEPYVDSLDKKPELLQRLLPVLAARAEIMDSLREQLQKNGSLPANITVTSSRLLASKAIRAHTIVKFTSGLPAEPTQEQTAAFHAGVINSVTPIVVSCLGKLRS